MPEPTGSQTQFQEDAATKPFLGGSRITIEVRVNTDPVPGWGYDPQDYVAFIQRHLDQTMGHYKPEVRLV